MDDEALAVEDIAAVGPFGDFLSLDATMRHMREQSQPKYLDRRVREDWKERGGSDLYARARAAALEIIESHKPEPLDPDAAEADPRHRRGRRPRARGGLSAAKATTPRTPSPETPARGPYSLTVRSRPLYHVFDISLSDPFSCIVAIE